MSKSKLPANNAPGSLFGVNNDSGMLSSKVIMTTMDAKAFLKKLYTTMIVPTLKIAMAVSDKEIKSDNYHLIMSIFSSIRIDCDLFDLTILEDNTNTQVIQEGYKRNRFYHLNASPAIDKKNKEVCVLFDMYKSPDTDPLVFLDEIKRSNGELVGYLYMKELIGLAQKNYKNKFTLANRARMFMYQSNPKMDPGLRDEGAVALAKMAMEFHTNSMLLDNFNDRISRNASTLDNLNYLKNNPMILYDPEYNYKMTQLDILEKLLEDAEFEFIDMNDQQKNGNSNNNQNGEQQPEDSDDGNNMQQGNDEDEGLDRDSVYSSRNESDDSNESSEESNDSEDAQKPSGSSDDGKFLKITLKKNKFKCFFMKMPPRKQNDRYDMLDSSDERSIDTLQDHIDYSMQKLKGTGINEIFESIGAPISWELDWEKEIIRFVDNITNMTNSNKYENSWRKINTYTRHLTTLPGKKPIPESVPTIYILFDQSGSMTNNIIRKINYVIEYFYKKRYNINVLIHDDSEKADDVSVYEFRPRNSGGYNDNYKLDDLVNHRFMAGGTSHKGVFDLMEVYIKEISQTTKKYNTQYVFICSDLYSDIEEIYKNYEWTTLLNNTTFALCPEKDRTLPFGKTRYIS